MQAEFATTNVNRSYWLGATSIAIFTFMLFFLYPRTRVSRSAPFCFK